MASIPRVAVIGGGIAGTLCSLVLKNRGLQPTIVDAGNQVGGRLRRTGAQFLRTTDPRLATVIGFLEREGLLAEWKGRFGMLGSAGGGFLPAEIVTQNSNRAAQGPPPDTQDTTPPATDGGDFCKFVEGSTYPTFVGVPSMAHVCPGICTKAGIETWNRSTLTHATPLKQGGWTLDIQKGGDPAREASFDALVVATHDPSVAASVIDSIVEAEQAANPQDASGGQDSALVIGILSDIANALQNVRNQHKQPVYTVTLTFPEGFADKIPFDAVSIPGSQLVQFLAKDASKPNTTTTTTTTSTTTTTTWTAVTTTRMASVLLSNEFLSDDEKVKEVERQVAHEVSKLLRRYTDIEPLETHSFRWGAAFSSPGLQLKEDSIVLSPWRLAVCGDYIRESSAYSNPWEAAALSGLQAGERTAAFWKP